MPAPFPLIPQPSATARPLAYLWALLACLATAAVSTPLLAVVDLVNIVMLFLLTVVLVAIALGVGPGVVAAFASVAVFDFFFVPPRFSMRVNDAQYLITFAVMLIVALIIGRLAGRLREEADAAAQREEQTAALYAMASRLSAVLNAEQVSSVVRDFLAGHLGVEVTLFLPDEHDVLHAWPPGDTSPDKIAHVIDVFHRGEAMALAAADSAYAPALALPLSSPLRTRGVLLARAHAAEQLFAPAHRALLDAVTSVTAIAVERLHFSEVAQRVTLDMESERLRSTLLSAVSHDLRTPLTVLVGLADSLCYARPALPTRQLETATALRDEVLRLSELVHKLLDMARLQVGKPRLKREWQPLEEIIGSSLRAMQRTLAGREVSIALPADLPPLDLDAALMERVYCNLLENAVKHAPGSPIFIAATRHGERVDIAIEDHGPGLPANAGERIFGVFERGRPEDGHGGVGLGLAICRIIVEAHGGSLRGENRAGGGARFIITLPVGAPPALVDDDHE
jgi:two-component system sensor histidine kinase KdpD